MHPGYIYILRNPAFSQNLFKISMTTRSPQERVAELSQASGVPDQYELLFVEWVPNCERAEKLLHQSLGEYRHNKEFFKVPLKKAISEARFIADSLRFDQKVEGNCEDESLVSHNIYEEFKKIRVEGEHIHHECEICHWSGYEDELKSVKHHATGAELAYCPVCGIRMHKKY